MTTISRDANVVTLIDIFTVAPEKQEQLVEMVDDTLHELVRHLPGFISASLHKSLDGTRVVDYVQFASRADFEAMLAHPEMQQRIAAAVAIAKAEPLEYVVVDVVEPAK